MSTNACRLTEEFSILQVRALGNRFVALPRLFALSGLIAATVLAGAQVSQPAPDSSENQYTLELNADLVVLNATVIDRHNVLVSGLEKNNFQIYEDGVLQTIKQCGHEDVPVTAGIVVDSSGSMGPKRGDVIAAALAFAGASNPQDQVFIVNFNDSVSFGLPPGTSFTDKKEQLQRALSRTRTIGRTALYDGIVVALEHLKLATYDKKVLVLISDGGDNASTHTLAQVIGMARQSSTIIYTIGIFDEQDGDQNPSVLRRFASQTGGEAFFPQSSKDVASICERIAHDIRNQYTLTYIPRIASLDGKYRTVEVKASSQGRGRLSVRTRAGYSVPAKCPDSKAQCARP